MRRCCQTSPSGSIYTENDISIRWSVMNGITGPLLLGAAILCTHEALYACRRRSEITATAATIRARKTRAVVLLDGTWDIAAA